MKILFIYPTATYKTYHCGIAILSAVLKKAGHITEMEFVHDWKKETVDKLTLKIRKFHPNLIGISSVTNQLERTQQIVGLIKDSGIPIVVGGVHATFAPEEVIKLDGILGLCIGEGEAAILELIEALEEKKDYRKINNWWFKKGNDIIKNPLRFLIQDLDNLPFADYDIFNYQDIIDEFGVLQLFANRGCPYTCSYCVNHTLMDLYFGKGKFVRFRKVENLMEELTILSKKFKGIEQIEFFDDTFILDINWLREFSEKYPKTIGIPFRCNTRANLINPMTVDLLKKSGCYTVNMAIETGNEKLRMEVLNKEITNAQLISAFELLKQAGIKTYAHNMIGIPYETIDAISQTIALNRKVKVNDLQCWVFYPYPGTKLYELCRNNHWISDRKITNVTGLDVESVLEQPSISRKDVLYYHVIFKSEVLAPNSIKAFFFRFMAKNAFFLKSYLFLRHSIKKLLLDLKKIKCKK